MYVSLHVLTNLNGLQPCVDDDALFRRQGLGFAASLRQEEFPERHENNETTHVKALNLKGATLLHRSAIFNTNPGNNVMT